MVRRALRRDPRGAEVAAAPRARGAAGRPLTDARDDPARIESLRRAIRGKPSLHGWYRECYVRFAVCLTRCPQAGSVLELGSGAGFLPEIVPGVVTSDVLPYAGVERVIDAARLPFGDGELRGIFLLNVFHHLPDVGAFLAEAERCLAPGGRVLIVDQECGWISKPILRWAHSEPFDPGARDWRFEPGGPLSAANGALAWIVFRRDRERFEREHPGLHLEGYRPHTPLLYFLAGGLKRWSVLPGAAFGAAAALDRALLRISPRFGSFVDIELVRA